VRLVRKVSVERPLETVFGYLSDFTTTEEWDPATVSTVRVSGDGGVGTSYLNTSRFAGRETELTYVVEELVPQRRLALRGANRSVVAHDTMDFRWTGRATEVTYTAEFEFQGVARLAGVLLRPALKKLADDAEGGMRRALQAL